jgi:hypothetical protein
MVDNDLRRQAGLPESKYGEKAKRTSTKKEEIRHALRIQDEQVAINRYTWYGLPDITGQELERMLYYRGQICIFYSKELKKFFYLPYALNGGIDLYSRFMKVRPVRMGSAETQKEDGNTKALDAWLGSLDLKVHYDVVLPEDLTTEMLYNSTVLLHDYSKQNAQTITPRQQLDEAFIDMEAECMPFMRTALALGTGITAIRVDNKNTAALVDIVSQGLIDAALAGQGFLPIVGQVEFQELTEGQLAKAEEFLLAQQSLQNFRMGLHGIGSGAIFEKKAHELQSEADMSGSNVGMILQDGLALRQNFCNIVNSIWGLGIWCEVSEVAAGADKNMDGEISDEQDGTEKPIDQQMNEQEAAQ